MIATALASTRQIGNCTRFNCSGIPLILAVPLYKLVYRISWPLSIGVTILVSIVATIIAMAFLVAAAMLWSVHPAALVAGIVVGLSIPLLLWWRDRRLQKTFDAVR